MNNKRTYFNFKMKFPQSPVNEWAIPEKNRGG